MTSMETFVWLFVILFFPPRCALQIYVSKVMAKGAENGNKAVNFNDSERVKNRRAENVPHYN